MAMMANSGAFIFDLNGTLIDDMEFHIKAWYGILNDDLKANLSWQEVKEQMYGKNTELLVRVFGDQRFTNQEMDILSIEKEKRYQQAYLPHLALLPGLATFLEQAAAKKIPMAIGSAAIQFNVDFVLDGLGIRHYFDSIVCADNVKQSKPHPETFLKCATALNVSPTECVVFEDAPKGVEAALNAGMKAIVLTTMHRADEFTQYPNVLQFVKDYTQLVPL